MTQGTDAKVEGAVPTQPEEKPTGKTYTEDEFQKAVSKGLESTQRQLDLRKAEADKAKAEAEQFKAESASRQARIDAITQEVEEALADDPERRQAFISRSKNKIADLEREERIAKREAEAEKKLYDVEILAWSVRMAQKAAELVKETGIDSKELESCQTEEEMEVRALRFERANKGSAKEAEEKPPKFDSGMGSGAGLDLDKMSPDEKVKYGLSQKK